MARQHVHNRRAGRGNTGASWISYSDIMAALLLVFVLFLTYNLYQYNSMIEIKTNELNQKQALLDEKEGFIIIQQGKIDSQQIELDQIRLDLDAKQDELDKQTIILIGQQEELENAKATLASQQTELDKLQILLASREMELNAATELLGAQQAALDAQQAAFNAQSKRLDALVGVRTQIIQDLSIALAGSNLNASVDKNTGDITLESTVFFNTASYTIKDEGQRMLDQFLPLYLSVLLRPEYADYLGEIIIEGHTDSDGSYLNNLELSQNRALTVAKYCLSMPSLSRQQRNLLQSILTAKGRSSSDLIYNADGTENKDASRRVEFKFSLRDSDMINQMREILNGNLPGGIQ